CYGLPVLSRAPALPGLVASLPFLLSVVLYWFALYPADRAIRQVAIEVYLVRSRPVQPVWSRGQFLMFNLRHQMLFILAPMLLILIVRDIVSWYDEELTRISQYANVSDLILGAVAGFIAIVAPVMLRYIWVTQRLPDGPLRDRLRLLAKKLRMGCREILVWKSGGMLVNAAVMGVFAPVRYVLLTDGMLSQMDDTKIEAVFGHEAGHVKRHHILFFLLFALISGCVLTIFSIRIRGTDRETYQIASAVMGSLLLLKWGVLFFWVSRKFERQADLFGVRALQIAGVPCSQVCPAHGNPSEPETRPNRAEAMCVTCADIFSATLYDVAILNGIAPDSGSMRHGTIASRSMFLQKLVRDPAAAARFERSVLMIKSIIVVAAVGFSAWAAVEMRLWELAASLLRTAGVST
ncbi:MAG: M48 family metallopeptidase, partial [Phycisphaerae bacterium]